MSLEESGGEVEKTIRRDGVFDVIMEVVRVALPLMVSAGTFSLVLFADRTLLLKYDGQSMSASMAGGNLFWVLVCLPVGIASMTGAIVSQYVGSGKESMVGRFLWQSVWLSMSFAPWFALIAWIAPWIFEATGQPASLVKLESTYLRLLMLGAVGLVLETGLSGFFSGTERTGTIMGVSVASGLLNVVLDVVMIFGVGHCPELGISGAALASAIAFWSKAVCYGVLLLRPRFRSQYSIALRVCFDRPLFRKLLFFGFPTGLMYITEAGGFTFILLRIGQLGDVPLRATTMAINFNMVAFIPLVGVSVAASVLVGRHLMESGPRRAILSVYASLLIGLIYSTTWLIAYLTIGDWMMTLYDFSSGDADSAQAIAIAKNLLTFVAIYVVLDAIQLIVAGALRGAGDTWFVLFSGFGASALAIAIGVFAEPNEGLLNWWWWMVTLWVWMLALVMVLRFIQGKWKSMTMVGEVESAPVTSLE